mmetsp:Transcript_26967/g.93620  ORF Transcript_26967/g.93620 Transcript_26967/m.93620 type:complete len:262 (+) Transcript_26967:725-1510(+)
MRQLQRGRRHPADRRPVVHGHAGHGQRRRRRRVRGVSAQLRPQLPRRLGRRLRMRQRHRREQRQRHRLLHGRDGRQLVPRGVRHRAGVPGRRDGVRRRVVRGRLHHRLRGQQGRLRLLQCDADGRRRPHRRHARGDAERQWRLGLGRDHGQRRVHGHRHRRRRDGAVYRRGRPDARVWGSDRSGQHGHAGCGGQLRRGLQPHVRRRGGGGHDHADVDGCRQQRPDVCSAANHHDRRHRPSGAHRSRRRRRALLLARRVPAV